jgi:acyl-CoA synthetase (AMP-forming)/AMP-acid ligase II
MQLLVGDVFRRAAASRPGVVAARLGAGTLTFGDLDAAGNRFAHVLVDEGVTHGERVVWQGETSLDVLPLFVALARIGAVFAPVNPALGQAETDEILALARPVLTLRPDDLLALGRRASAAPVVEIDDPGLREDDAHVVFFTSGSTGRPKGVVLSHRVNLLRTFPSTMPPPGTGTVCMFPLFHMAGWSIALGCWQARLPVTFVERADAESLLRAVETSRASRLYAIPAVWERILAADRSRYDLSRLEECDTGTSATPPELLAAIKDAFPGTRTRVFYGSTEAGPGTVLADADLDARPGSAGQPATGVEVRLGEDGEVLLRSPYLMSGYFDDPVATTAALAGGWYHTGDLGVLDDDGYLSITGRVREVIRTGGETVAPAEVEVIVAAHPAVAEAAVIGVPDPTWGEVVCAVVVPKEGASVDLETLRDHCEMHLAPYKVPRRLVTVDALPRTPATGQVQRTLVADLVARESSEAVTRES